MPLRRPLVRLLRGAGLFVAGVLVVVGGLGLEGPGLVAVGVAGSLAAAIAVGFSRDDPGSDRRAVANSAIQAGGGTVGVLLALAGLAALAGVLVALLAGAVAAAAWLAARLAQLPARTDGDRAGPVWPLSGAEVLLLPVPPPEEGDRPAAAERTSPVSGLATSALGREWLRTSALLAGRLHPHDRQALVRRRAETLDELERRDPAGFARWLAAGPAPGSDPAAYVRGRSAQGGPAAGSDAA